MPRKVREKGEYKFEDAYDIRGRGVGTLNLGKALKSDAFVTKVRELALSMKNVSTEMHSGSKNSEPKKSP